MLLVICGPSFLLISLPKKQQGHSLDIFQDYFLAVYSTVFYPNLNIYLQYILMATTFNDHVYKIL